MGPGLANALLPTPGTRLNELKLDNLTNKKRKAGDDDTAGDLGDQIILQPFQAENAQQKIFNPRRLIARSDLPLVYIRGHNQQSSNHGASLFSAHIWSLEHNGVGDTEKQDSVLIVQDEQDGTLAAIERVYKGVYAICCLVDRVTVEDFSRTSIKRPRFHLKSEPLAIDGAWWESASVRPDSLRGNTKPAKRLLELVLSGKPASSTTEPASIVRDVGMKAADSISTAQSDAPKQATSLNEISIQSTSDAISSLRSQYLETLYISRAPLAYFAKGPLSRARVAYQERNAATSTSTQDELDLIDLLRSSVLPVKAKGNSATVDMKYATAIVDLIQEIPPGVTGDDETEQLKSVFGNRIRKSRKRKKLSTDGLLPGEEDYVIRWWINRESSMSCEGPEDTKENRIRTAASELRARELQLQIILILEIFTLQGQPQHRSNDAPENTCPNADSQTQSTNVKQKKSMDLTHIMDVLIEKLQIWETTSQGLGVMFGDDSGTRLRSKGPNGNKSNESDDCLKSFCSDIVIPFYSSRIPEAARAICHKLGFINSPQKRQIARTVSTGKIRNRPGASIKESSVQPPRKTLERVLSDERIASRRPTPSLSRSATDSVLPVIKQEFEDAKLNSISLYRQSIEQSKLYARREVDLTAEAKATQAKLKRKITVEQELKGAIDALKKPNARLAVKEFVEASDERNSNRKSKPRKSQNPTRNPFATGVQVTATPKANRIRLIRPTMQEQYQVQSEILESDIIAPSSDPKVPSSSMRPSGRSLLKKQTTISMTPRKSLGLPNALQSSIEATPSGRASKQLQRSHLAAMIELEEDEADDLGSPELPRLKSHRDGFKRPGLPRAGEERASLSQTSLRSTPSKPRRSTVDVRERGNESAIIATPVKGSAASAIPQSSPPVGLPAISARSPTRESSKSTEDEKSIYEALGWDDDFDDLV